MSELTIDYVLTNFNPCDDGAEWLSAQPDLVTAWDNCHRSDWMLWLSDKLSTLTIAQDLAIQLGMLETPLADGRCVLDLITDERSLAFIEVKRQRTAGVEIEPVSWAAAMDASRVAAWDAARVARVARDASWAATRTATWDVAWAAAASAARAAAWFAANTAAHTAASAWQADKIREIVGNPFRPQVDKIKPPESEGF